MRSWLTTLFLILALILVQGCSRTGTEGFADEPEIELDLDAIRERGYITALLDNNSVSYFIYKGQPMGYEYELLQQLASTLKVTLKIKLITSIEQAINMLNTGEGDVLAFPLTITPDRMEYISFTDPHFDTRQVLVQKKPANWRMLSAEMLDKKLARIPEDLAGQDVYIKKESVFRNRLMELNAEFEKPIRIYEDSAAATTESLIQKVATGEIKYTVTDEYIANVNSLYYSNLDISTVLTDPQQIAWAVRNNAPELLNEINVWLRKIKKSGVYNVVYNKYFKSTRLALARVKEDYALLDSRQLSPFDEQLKKGAEQIGWDWRLVASVVYQESNFNPKVKSWAGAIGLMQIMPETGQYFGVKNLWDPSQNINAGVKFLKFLDKHWAKTVDDPEERMKFVLASYNVGLSHVIDAQKLAIKYDKNPALWEDNVEFYLLQKSDPKYFRDPVAAVGYCRCDGPVRYVKEVLQRYDEYKLRIAA